MTRPPSLKNWKTVSRNFLMIMPALKTPCMSILKKFVRSQVLKLSVRPKKMVAMRVESFTFCTLLAAHRGNPILIIIANTRRKRFFQVNGPLGNDLMWTFRLKRLFRRLSTSVFIFCGLRLQWDSVILRRPRRVA